MNSDQIRIKTLQIIANLYAMGAIGIGNAIPYSYVFVDVDEETAKTIARHWEIDRLVNSVVIDQLTGFPDRDTTRVDISQHYYYLRASSGTAVVEIIEFLKQYSDEELSAENRNQLSSFISKYFELNEIEQILFKLDIDYEDIKRETKSSTVLRLMNYLRKRKKLSELVDIVKQERSFFKFN